MSQEYFLPAGSLHTPYPIRMVMSETGMLEIAPGHIKVNEPVQEITVEPPVDQRVKIWSD